MVPKKRKAGIGDIKKPLKLTRKNLALFNSLNGDNNSNNDEKNSGYPESESDSADTMKKTSATSSGFQQQTYENGILGPAASKLPQDFNTIQHHLTQRRSSTQPSECTHRQYCFNVSKSYNENRVSTLIQSKIMKEYNDLNYNTMADRAINRIPEQDFNHNLSNPRPDLLNGLDTDALPDSLHNHALHNGENSLSLCHFATEFKRINGNLHQATYQAAYDGATLVYARDQALAKAAAAALRNSNDIEKATKETAVFTCATDGKTAEVFAHHFQNGEYHQNLVARESLLSYPNRGREVIRNTQDYARSKSYQLAALLGANLKEEEWKEEEEEEKKGKEEKREGVKGWGRFWPF